MVLVFPVAFLAKTRYDNDMIRRFLERIGILRKASWAERHFTLVLIIAAALFMAISLTIGLHQSVWFDEAYSILLAKQSVGQLLHLTSVDTHPPLYYLLLKGWAFLFGWSELALRSLSVLAAGGAVLLGGLLVKRTFGTRAALMTLPFIVFAPFLLRYGFEIRMYAVASLIGIAATYVLVCAVQAKESRRQRQWYALYAVLVAVGVYTLYYTAVLWIAHVVWLVWLARRQKRPLVKEKWVAALAGSVLLFAPWLPTFVEQLSNGALAPVSQPLTIDALAGIVSFMFVYQPSWQLNGLMSLAVLFVIVTVVYFAARAWRSVSSQQKPYLVLSGLYVAVPVAVVALISLVRPMYIERYLAHVLIGGSLFVGIVTWAALQKGSKKMRAAAAGLLAVMLFGVMHLAQVGNYNFQRIQTLQIKQAVAAVGACGQGKTILAADPYVAIELSYYLPDCDVHFYSESVALKGGYAPLSNSSLRVQNPASELAASREIVYVYYDPPKLSMPTTLHKTSEQAFDALHVTTFSAERPY